MTARWSGVFTNDRRKRLVRKILDSGAGGFPTANEGSPKVVLLRVLVTRTSVVETNSRHLGDARKWSRKAKTSRSVERR